LFRDPLIGAGLKEIQGETSAIEHFVVESADIKLGTQFFPGTFAPVNAWDKSRFDATE